MAVQCSPSRSLKLLTYLHAALRALPLILFHRSHWVDQLYFAVNDLCHCASPLLAHISFCVMYELAGSPLSLSNKLRALSRSLSVCLFGSPHQALAASEHDGISTQQNQGQQPSRPESTIAIGERNNPMYCVIRRRVIFFQFPSTCLVLSPRTTTDHAVRPYVPASRTFKNHSIRPGNCVIFAARSSDLGGRDHRLLVSWMVPETKALVRMQRTQQQHQPDRYIPVVAVIVPRHNQEWFWPENFLSSKDVDGKQNSSAKGKW